MLNQPDFRLDDFLNPEARADLFGAHAAVLAVFVVRAELRHPRHMVRRPAAISSLATTVVVDPLGTIAAPTPKVGVSTNTSLGISTTTSAAALPRHLSAMLR